jgi:hypothetical protein
MTVQPFARNSIEIRGSQPTRMPQPDQVANKQQQTALVDLYAAGTDHAERNRPGPADFPGAQRGAVRTDKQADLRAGYVSLRAAEVFLRNVRT